MRVAAASFVRVWTGARTALSVVGAIGICLFSGVSTAATPIQNGAAYLATKVTPRGAYGQATGTDPVLTTSEVVLALSQALGPTAPAVIAAQAYLRGESPAELDLQARRLAALSGTVFADVFGTAAFESQALAPGFGFAAGDTAASPLESALAIAVIAQQQLAAAGQVPLPISTRTPAGCSQASVVCTAILPYLNTLLAAQNSDGGWGFSGESSNLRLTAEILTVLNPLRPQLSVDGALTRAEGYLVAQQATDGHFGSAAPATADTSAAAIALVGGPANDAALVAKAMSYLQTKQVADGSWDESELNTALVLRALTASAAKLSLQPSAGGTGTTVSLSAPNPSSGSTDKVTVTLANTTGSPSGTTTVVFTAVAADGGTTVLGTTTVPASDAGTLTVSATLNTSGLSGDYHIVATLQGESAPGATQASTPTHISAPDDLSVATSDITFKSIDGGVVNVGVTVHENGPAIATPFQVAVYVGPPDAGGAFVGEEQVLNLPQAGSATVQIPWSVSAANSVTPIYVWVDPLGVVADANPSNNLASTYFSAPVVPVDLQVTSSDITIDGPFVPAGLPLKVHVQVANFSMTNDAFDVPVAICASQENPLIATLGPSCPLQIVNLPYVQHDAFTLANFTLGPELTTHLQSSYYPSTPLYVTALVDPYQQIPDPNRTNNSAPRGFNIMNGSAFRLLGGFYCDNRFVYVTAEVHSASDGALRLPWALFQGDPDYGGVALQRGVIDAVIGGTTNFNFNAPRPDGGGLLVLQLDPEKTMTNLTPYLTRITGGCEAPSSDLELSFSGVSVIPVGPSVGDTSTVSVAVVNDGGASTTVLEALVGDPFDVGTTLLGRFPISLDAGQSTTVTFPWTRTGDHTNLFLRLTDTVPPDIYPDSYDDQTYEFRPTTAIRSAFVEAVYAPGRTSYNGSFPTSSPTVGDLFRSGRPAIGLGESLSFYDAGSGLIDYTGRLTILQESPTNFSLEEQWMRPVGRAVGQPVFIDLGHDAGPKIVFLSAEGSPSFAQPSQFAGRSNTIHVWRPDSGVVWEKTFVLPADGGLVDICMNENNLVAPGLGDVNGDGVVDVIFPTADGVLHVLDGLSGAVVWEVALPAGTWCPVTDRQSRNAPPLVLDLLDAGSRNVLVALGDQNAQVINYWVYDKKGNLVSGDAGILTPSGYLYGTAALAVASLSGIGGSPALIETNFPNVAATASSWNGSLSWASDSALLSAGQYSGQFATIADPSCRPLSVVSVRQGAVGLSFSGGLVWTGAQELPGTGNPEPPRSIAAADLLGLGTPQIIASTTLEGLMLLSARDGTPVLHAETPLSDMDGDGNNGEFYDLAVADTDGTGRGRVVMNNVPDLGDGYGPGAWYISSVGSSSFLAPRTGPKCR